MTPSQTLHAGWPGGPSPEATFRALIRTFGLAERAMHAHFQAFGISGAQWGVLRNLHRSEEEGQAGLRLTDLSQRLLIRPPSVTGVVDRLEDAGLVLRAAVANDLRGKQVGLTDRGRRLVARVLTVHADQVARVMDGLGPEEQSELLRLMTKLGGHLEGLLRGDLTD